jgi:sugar transferase EpsL
MKNILDFIISLLGIILLAPFLVIIGLIIFFYFGSPVFFIQNRPGFLGKPFKFYKYRTMTNQKDNNGKLLPDEKRLTSYGKFLRKTSIDELPSLWNVLKGDMSLVGPRPLLMEYLDYYSPEQARRHEVKPGITGWAQINGRNSISWEEKFELDVWYVDNQSFWLDIKIIFITIWKVIRAYNINNSEKNTMPIFMGTRAEKRE